MGASFLVMMGLPVGAYFCDRCALMSCGTSTAANPPCSRSVKAALNLLMDAV